jgi:hypothetical protein
MMRTIKVFTVQALKLKVHRPRVSGLQKLKAVHVEKIRMTQKELRSGCIKF